MADDHDQSAWYDFLWKHRDELIALWKKAVDTLWGAGRSGARRSAVLILGPAGTGKTTLGRLLAGHDGPMLGAYEESLGVEKLLFKDDPESAIIVAPGQGHRWDCTWDTVGPAISAGQIGGIIFVGSFGYHTLGDILLEEIPIYRENPGAFLPRYLEEKQARELEVFERIAEMAAPPVRRLWFLTVVTKEDLWWPRQSEVHSFYASERFSQAVEVLRRKCGTSRFQATSAFASLVIENFVTGKGVELQQNVAGYDFRKQSESLARLMKTVISLRNWEDENV